MCARLQTFCSLRPRYPEDLQHHFRRLPLVYYSRRVRALEAATFMLATKIATQLGSTNENGLGRTETSSLTFAPN